VLVWLVAAGAMLSVVCAPVRADSRPLTISPQAPIQQVDSSDGLTDSPTFSLLVQATSGTTLTCTLDNQPVGCGPSPPTCPGTVCAVFTATAQSQGEHLLDVTDTDGAGHTVDQNSYIVSVDLTPPDTANLLLDDQLESPKALRPVFAFDIEDDNQPETAEPLVSDSAQCSFTPLGAAAVWSPCPVYTGPDEEEEFEYTPLLAATPVVYLFQGRAVDTFGRVDPTPVSMQYDPMPCTVQVAAPRTVRKLFGAALTASVQCTGSTSAVLELYLLVTNGHAKPLNRVVGHSFELIPPTRLNGAAPRFTARRRLRISANDILIRAEKTVARARSLALAVAVQSLTYEPYVPLTGTAQLTIAARRGNGRRH
jgi:hypothetical protein